MNIDFKNQRNEPNLISTLSAFEETLKYNKINCCRVGIIDEYDPKTRVAKVLIANKLVLGIDENGSQITNNYAPIYAKVIFFGWREIGITHPVLKGSEGILLFNDREIESWFVNGNINNLSYKRAHSKTDAFFISGILSLPNMIENLQDCINIFYKLCNIQVRENGITINGNTTINGNLTVNGNINASGDIVAGSISLKNHVHTSGAPGSDTSAPKG